MPEAWLDFAVAVYQAEQARNQWREFGAAVLYAKLLVENFEMRWESSAYRGIIAHHGCDDWAGMVERAMGRFPVRQHESRPAWMAEQTELSTELSQGGEHNAD